MKKEFNLKNTVNVSIETVKVLEDLQDTIMSIEADTKEEAVKQIRYIFALSVAIAMLSPEPDPLIRSHFSVN